MSTRRSLWIGWTGRLFVAAAIAVALGYLPYQFFSHAGVLRYLSLRQEAARLRDENVRLGEINVKLRAELSALTEDSTGTSLSRATIERVARDELGLVRPGELVFALEGAAR